MKLTVMIKAALGMKPGVSLGPSSKFSRTHKLAKRKKLRKGCSTHLYKQPMEIREY